MTQPPRPKSKSPVPESSGRLFKILSHPLRQRILVSLHEMEEGSPTQLADRLGQPVGNVSYHVKVLAEADAIELIRTEPRRGALEHFYRPLWEQVVDAGRTEGSNDEGAHASWTPLQLDEKGYAAVTKLLGETMDRLVAIEAEAQGRSADGGGELTPTEVAILHLRRD